MKNRPAHMFFRQLHEKLDYLLAGQAEIQRLLFPTQGKSIMTLAQDQAAAQAAFQADFNQFKIDFSAAIAALRTAANADDEAALEASIAGLQTMDADLKGLDATAVSAVTPPVVTPPPPPTPAPPVPAAPPEAQVPTPPATPTP